MSELILAVSGRVTGSMAKPEMKKGISPNRQCGMERQVHIKWPIPKHSIDTVFRTGYHLIEVEKSCRPLVKISGLLVFQLETITVFNQERIRQCKI